MDYSFLRFIPDFNRAKDLQNSKTNDFDYDIQIHLKPGESYSAITNCENGISFASLYKAYIVDSEDNQLLEITNNVFIEEFINSQTGLKQIKLEIVEIPGEFYTDLCFLRLDHDIVNGNKYWSNAFILSDYDVKETIRFRFKNYSNLDGTNYKVANIYQSIRLKCSKVSTTFTSSKQQYTTFSGLVNTSRVIKTKYYEYIFDMCSDFIYERLQYLLCHDIIYIDNVRVTEKQTFENSDKFNNSVNISQNKFKCAVNELDIDSNDNQLFVKPRLLVASKIPTGNLSLSNYAQITAGGSKLFAYFNYPVIDQIDLQVKLYVNGIFTADLDWDITGDTLQINLPFSVPDFDYIYSIVINANSIFTVEQLGNIYFDGYTIGEWTFTVIQSDYDTSDYDENEYL